MAYIVTMQTRPVTVAETTVFLRQAADVWTDDERSEFVDFIARNPEVGYLIPGTNGVRKNQVGSARGRETRWRAHHLLLS